MKYLLLLSFLFLNTICLSQKFNPISEVDLDAFPNGWFKFVTKTAVFDVEINNHQMVKGNITWMDESTYAGDLKNNRLSGKGTYIWPNGLRYEGSFKNNMRHGRGSLILQDGTKWFGKWTKNKKNGKGRVYDSSGKITKKGTWENDILIIEKVIKF